MSSLLAPHKPHAAPPDSPSWSASSLALDCGDDDPARRPWTRQQLVQMLVELLGVVFVAEALLMVLVWALSGKLPYWAVTLVDTSLLSLTMATVAYLRIVRPLGQDRRAMTLRSAAVLCSIRDGVLLIDRQAVIQDANPAARAILGATDLAAVCGLPLRQFLRCVEPACESCFLRDPDGQRREGEYRIFGLDGQQRTVELRRQFLPGQTLEVLSVHDITQRVRDADALARARDQAEQATRAKSVFLANMSHELRTPINGISGASQLLMQTQPSAEQQELLGIVENSAKGLLHVISDLLDFSKLEAGKMPIERVAFDLEQCLSEAVEAPLLRAQKKGLEIIIDLPPDLPRTVLGDPLRLKQVLINLLGNAVKFTSRGSVTLRARVRGQPGASWTVIFSVVDTGIGIAADKQQQIFESFSQADDSTTRRFGGTGLGLAIARDLCRRMGGDLSVQSQPGVGSTFTAVVCVGRLSHESRPEARDDSTVAVDGAAPADGAVVLVADDDAVNRLVATRLLEKAGCQVRVATSGEEALLVLGVEDVQMVLMDLHMPGMDGLEAVRQIRLHGDPLVRALPVVAMTASVRPQELRSCLDAGMNGHLLKPFHLDEVRRTLAEFLS